MKKKKAEEDPCPILFEALALRSILIKKGIVSEEAYEKMISEVKSELKKNRKENANLKNLLSQDLKIDYIG